MPVRPRRLVPADPLTRRLATATLVSTFGNGLFFAVSALFFTRVIGLSVAQVGVGLTIAGGLGVVAGVPAGRLADRFGATRVFAALATVEAIGLCAYGLVDSMAQFLVVVCVVQVCDRGNSTVRNALIAVVVPAAARATTRAYLRAVTNVGMGAGAAFGALALQADTRAAYLTMVLLDAATFVVARLIMLRLPVDPRPASGGAGRGDTRRAFTDRPYLAITAVNGVLAMQFAILDVGLPLWIVGHTDAPRLMVSVALVLNTVLVVVLQVPASRGMRTPMAAARGGLRSSVLIAGGCVLYATAADGGAWLAVLVIVAGCVLHTLGEILCSAAGWTLSYDLADQSAPGLYQGVFQSGFNLGVMLSPLLITSSAIRFGFGGWLVLAAVFVLAGLALAPVTRWAERTRVPASAVVAG